MPLFQVVDKPYLFPQMCGFCGNPAEKPVIDTGVIVPGLNEGRLYICFDCTDDLARVGGYATRDEWATAKATADEMQNRVDQLPIQIRKAASDINDIADRVVRGLLPDIAPVGVAVHPQLDFVDAESLRAAEREYPFTGQQGYTSLRGPEGRH